jgi:hypothetical protein
MSGATKSSSNIDNFGINSMFSIIETKLSCSIFHLSVISTMQKTCNFMYELDRVNCTIICAHMICFSAKRDRVSGSVRKIILMLRERQRESSTSALENTRAQF